MRDKYTRELANDIRASNVSGMTTTTEADKWIDSLQQIDDYIFTLEKRIDKAVDVLQTWTISA